jgi:predicted enzyme related to lactoylglutathione lyase
MRVRGYADGTPCWAAVATSNIEASRAFYSALFGWEFADGRFALEGRAVAGVRDRGLGPSAWLMSVSTDDAAQVTQVVEGARGRIRAAPQPAGSGGTGLPTGGADPAEGAAAVFSDPAGAVFSVWQRGTFGGAQVAMEPGAICWYELATPDLAGADDFYGTVFGWRVHEAESAPGDPYFEFRHNDDAVAGLLPVDHRFPSRDMRAHWTVCFLVDDCAQSCDRAADLGGVVARKPMTVATGWYARLADPEGAHFAIIELAEELRIDF